MTILRRLASIASWILRRDRAEQQLDDEIRSFVEMSTAERVEEGIPPAEARRLALAEIGGVERIKERVRMGRHGALLDDLGRDVRYAFRLVARQRTFTAVIVATLALGIGANTAIFSILDGLLLRTLPIEHPERLAQLVAAPPSEQDSWTYPIWHEIQRHSVRFDGAFVWTGPDAEFDLSTGGESRFVNGVWASAGAFAVLGVRPVLGRLFEPSDDIRGGGSSGPVVVISHAFWQTYFSGTRDVIGRTLTLERVPLTIVGVTPRGFFGVVAGRSFDVVVPLGVEPLIRGSESRLDRRTSWWLQVFVRLKPGQSREAAAAVMQTLKPGIREATLPPTRPGRNNDRYLADPFTLVDAERGPSSRLREGYSRPLLVLMVVVGLVLLIACANIANLLLARATARHHEWSVRLALGATPGRLARQLMIESLLLAAIGAAAGVFVADSGSRLLIAQLASDSVSLELPLDARMLAFTAGVALIAALVFGVAPAWRATRGVPIDAMKDRGRVSGASASTPLANGLVLVQVALSLVLLIGAGLFLRSFNGLTRVPLGFEGDRVLLTVIDARRADLAPSARLATYERIHERVLAIPGVEHAAVSITAPLGEMWIRRIEVSGSPLRGSDAPGVGPEGFGSTDRPIPANAPLAVFNGITSGWIATFGTPLLAGRDISRNDATGSPRVALVNQAFARKFLGGANPVGHTMHATREPGAPIEIVGLVADAVYRDIREATLPTAYVPLPQSVDRSLVEDPNMTAPAVITLSVRPTSGQPSLLTKGVAAAISEVNPTLALTFEPLDRRVSETLTRERLLAILSAAFGVLALVMASIGLYGVTSYAVSLRRTEIGIRMALGAARSAVIGLVLRRVALLVAGGLVVGLAVAVWVSRFVATLLYGLQPRDPLTILAASATLALIAAVAGWLPAHHASRLDPTQVLRDG
jgi:predicted permease